MQVPSGKIGELLLYKNNQLIAFNKPPTISVQPDPSEEKSLLELVEIYTHAKVHLIHRIDRPASGVVLFAKTPKALAALNKQFQERSIHKTYLAVVKQAPEPTSGQLIHFLRKDASNNRSKAFPKEIAHTKKAILNYRLLDKIENYSLLEIELITGRHHQIRAQLAAIQSPIKGDVKYGARRSNKDRSIHLHAWKLSFHHPVSLQKEEVIAPPPNETVWNAFKNAPYLSGE